MSSDADCTIINPCLIVIPNERILEVHTTTFAKEDWVKANDLLMRQEGAEAWLKLFLKTLSDSFRKSLATPISPYHAVVIAIPSTVPNETSTVISWLETNARIIAEQGNTTWLWRVIDMLESSAATA